MPSAIPFSWHGMAMLTKDPGTSNQASGRPQIQRIKDTGSLPTHAYRR